MLTTKHQSSFLKFDVVDFSLDSHLKQLEPRNPSQTYQYSLLRSQAIAASCSPPTPVSQIDNYRSNIEALTQRIISEINAIPSRPLVMGPYAQSVKSLVNYLNSLPGEFCIGPTNQDAFNRLNNAISYADQNIRRGNSIYEANFESYVNRAIPLLNALYNESNRINASSRDFTGVINAFRNYDSFSKQFNLEIWTLTPRIDQLLNQLSSLVNAADSALTRAINQIETNVEFEAQRFDAERKSAEDAFRHWDLIDGKQGYERYVDILRRITQSMIPDFNNFIQKVPNTSRISAAINRAQQSINQIDTGFNSFPNFTLLPSSSSSFPHMRYGAEERKFGGSAVIGALQSIAASYFSRTGKNIYIGDMQYEHGGKMGIHKSHKNGLDGDVDGVEIGDYPNNNKTLALALAKEILSAGAKLVFYADSQVVNDANTWAQSNGIAGRLQVEAAHSKHFHLRMPW
jgi:hypothetical protein